jgi:hypothetical protein
LAEGPVAPVAIDPHCPEVIVQGLVRRRDHHWSITLFLINDQKEPERLRDTAWVFQPELRVESPDGLAIFSKKNPQIALSGTDALTKAENDLLAMLYRRHVEFAVGHGMGVHADVSPDPTRAVRLRTKVVPDCEVPRTTPPPSRRCHHQSRIRTIGGTCSRYESIGGDYASSLSQQV